MLWQNTALFLHRQCCAISCPSPLRNRRLGVMTDDSLKTLVVPSHVTPDSSPLLIITTGFTQSPQQGDDWRRSGSVHRGFSLPLLPSHSFPMLQHGLIHRLHSHWECTCSSVGSSWAAVPLGSSCSGMGLFMGCNPFGGVPALVWVLYSPQFLW